MDSSCQISTDGMPRHEWLELRKNGIGGSDAAAACGLSEWKTRYELYLEKIGEIAPEAEKDILKWGRLMESPILLAARDITNLTIQPYAFMCRNPKFPWAFYNPDGVIGRDGLFEAKTSRHKKGWGKEGSDDIPIQYLLQVQHGMAVMNRSYCILAVSIGGDYPKIYRIYHDEDVIQLLMKREELLWKHVEKRIPPELDRNHSTAIHVVKRQFPKTNGSMIKLPREAQEWHMAIKELQEKRKEIETRIDNYKSRILCKMGNASIAALEDGTAYTRSLNKKGTLVLRHTEYTNFLH